MDAYEDAGFSGAEYEDLSGSPSPDSEAPIRVSLNKVFLSRLVTGVDRSNKHKIANNAARAAQAHVGASGATAMRSRLQRAQTKGTDALHRAAVKSAEEQKLTLCVALLKEVASVYGYKLSVSTDCEDDPVSGCQDDPSQPSVQELKPLRVNLVGEDPVDKEMLDCPPVRKMTRARSWQGPGVLTTPAPIVSARPIAQALRGIVSLNPRVGTKGSEGKESQTREADGDTEYCVEGSLDAMDVYREERDDDPRDLRESDAGATDEDPLHDNISSGGEVEDMEGGEGDEDDELAGNEDLEYITQVGAGMNVAHPPPIIRPSKAMVDAASGPRRYGRSNPDENPKTLTNHQKARLGLFSQAIGAIQANAEALRLEAAGTSPAAAGQCSPHVSPPAAKPESVRSDVACAEDTTIADTCVNRALEGLSPSGTTQPLSCVRGKARGGAKVYFSSDVVSDRLQPREPVAGAISGTTSRSTNPANCGSGPEGSSSDSKSRGGDGQSWPARDPPGPGNGPYRLLTRSKAVPSSSPGSSSGGDSVAGNGAEDEDPGRRGGPEEVSGASHSLLEVIKTCSGSPPRIDRKVMEDSGGGNRKGSQQMDQAPPSRCRAAGFKLSPSESPLFASALAMVTTTGGIDLSTRKRRTVGGGVFGSVLKDLKRS